MLPFKGYFNSLECPFYLSPIQCLRPYCQFKHPKRSGKNVDPQEKVVNSTDDVGNSVANILPEPIDEKPVVAPVKHIPIAYIPTKPSAVSVNIKKAKNTYVPSIKNDIGRNCLMASADYHPSSVMDSSEKTYSRYSYEKGHDSGDEIMENYKNLIETNKIGKFDDGSKSGYDEETDDYPDEPGFSSPNSPDEEDVEVQEEFPEESKFFEANPGLSTKSYNETEFRDLNDTSYKINNKRKYTALIETKGTLDHAKIQDESIISKIKTENNEISSEICSPKRIKTEENIVVSPNKIKSERRDSTSLIKASNQKSEGSNHIAHKVSKKSDKKDSKHKDKKHSSNSHRHSDSKSKEHSDNKRVVSDFEKHSSDKNDSKISKKHCSKSHSSETKKETSGSVKNQLDSKPKMRTSSSDSKKSGSESSKKHSPESKLNSSKEKKHVSDKKKLLEKESSSSKHSHEIKKHSTDKSCKKSSSSNKHSSDKKKHSSNNKKTENEKVSSSRKNKEEANKCKSTDKKHLDDRKHIDKKKDHHKSSGSSSKYKHDNSKNHKSKSTSSRNHDHGKSKKRKNSDSSESVVSTNDPKETILISDSSDSEENFEKSYTPVGIDDIFGSSDSGDNHFSDHGRNSHEVSDSEDDHDRYSPKSLLNSRESPVYMSSSSKNNIDEESNCLKNFKIASQVSVDESYKPAQTVSKVRIAHVPNVSSLLTAKTLINTGKTVPPAVKKLVTSIDMFKSKMNAKTLPQNTSTPRSKPVVSPNLNSVVALNIRQPGLNNIYDELIKFVDYDEACRRAIEEENEICNVATNPQSYRNRIALCILRIRKSKGAVNVVKKERITSNSIPDYTYGLTLYECFSKYLLQPEDYVLHGYPLEMPDKPGCAYVDKNSFFRKKHVSPLEGSFKKCINCGKEYAVDEETGIPLTKNNCHHHWGKLIGMRQGKIYTCCKSEVGSDPCHTSVYHITELKNEDCLEGFVKTRPYPVDADPNKAGIYAMDCEMCYTTHGQDIVRASLLAVDNESVYDVLIKPKYPILDYCTRFSGITEEQLKSVTTTLEDVQRFLLKTLNEKTILVGHSLENDLKALKLIHFNVVDTSIMFPHKEGFPVKCALRTLCSRILGTAIQTGENGHDSLEDARGCLQLVLHQVREDAKSRKPRVVKQLKTSK